MQSKVSPFLWFDNQAEEAVHFYTSIFPDSKILQVSRQDGKVFVISFEIFGQQFSALNGGPHYQFTPAVSFYVDCDTQEEVDRYWDAFITHGGREVRCGWLCDKYGVSWQIIPKRLIELLNHADADKRKFAMDAMLKMNKIVLKDLE